MSFFEKNIRILSLVEWLDWAGGNRNDVFVALPMIQRGSVWKPHQIIDLWDSLLQGMPIGCLMASDLEADTPIRRIGRKPLEYVPDGGGLGLIDGQQRTLAMLIAWNIPDGLEIDRRIWVDFADESAPGQLFRLRVTTTNQPFGFRRDDPSRKLSLADRGKALEKYYEYNGRNEPPSLKNALPFANGASLPIDLRWLIEMRRNINISDEWTDTVLEELNKLNQPKDPIANYLVSDDLIKKRIEAFGIALKRLFDMEIPLIRVDNRFFEIKNDESDSDPLLALLFRRIGTGGTKLSDADYVYSIIKHLRPETYSLVESLYEPDRNDHQNNIASLLTATDLVMSTVRLAVADWIPDDKKTPVSDKESLDKKEFHNLLRRGDFLDQKFMYLIKKEENGYSQIVDYFSQIQICLKYRGNDDIGIPLHLYPYLGRPLVQVLLRLAQIGYLKKDICRDDREDVLRLVLFWIVFVIDHKKASEIAYKVVKEISKENSQIGKAIYNELLNEEVAFRLIPPSEIEARPGLVYFTNDVRNTNCESRFKPVGDDETQQHKHVYDFYRRWWRPWTYKHPILLWLQRKYVSELKADLIAGRDEDTVYDYDHILPSSNWADWRGRGGRPKGFPDDMRVVGDGIGNVRVWDSIHNRQDGDKAPKYKLRLIQSTENISPSNGESLDMETILLWSAIPNIDEHKTIWCACSPVNDQQKCEWNLERMVAFQKAVELRTFDLYKCFYNATKELDSRID